MKLAFFRSTLIIVLLVWTSLAVAQDAETGIIIVDLWSYPAGDAYSFNFDASGGDYADFSLTHDAPPNVQELVPGIYSVEVVFNSGWYDDGHDCVSSIGDIEDNSYIELDAGETINCYFSYMKEESPLGIRMELETAWVQNYFWTIDKEVISSPSANAIAGETVYFDYEIRLSQMLEYNDYRAYGTVYVINTSPTPRSYRISGLLGGTLSVQITCLDISGAPTTVVQGNYTNECHFSVNNLEESAYEGQELVVSVVTTDEPPYATSSTLAVLDWSSEPVRTVVPQQIDVMDDAEEPFLDSRWASITTETVFVNQQSYTCPTDLSLYQNGQYSRSISNTSMIVETGASDTVSVTINCSAPIVTEECSYGQGYWRNHSENGNAPYDETWLGIGSNGSNTPFFLSGASYYEVMSTPPAGNVYYQLARQYIAAKLNILNGTASTAELDAALVWAETQFFNLYSPSQVPSDLRHEARAYATYNNGSGGVISCGE